MQFVKTDIHILKGLIIVRLNTETIKMQFVTEKEPAVDIERLDLSIRSYNCLRRAGLNTIDDIIHLSAEEILQVRNLGDNSIIEIQKTINSLLGYPVIKWVQIVSYY
jgi:DNA-directed RNA polymerase subunit alpha